MVNHFHILVTKKGRWWPIILLLHALRNYRTPLIIVSLNSTKSIMAYSLDTLMKDIDVQNVREKNINEKIPKIARK